MTIRGPRAHHSRRTLAVLAVGLLLASVSIVSLASPASAADLTAGQRFVLPFGVNFSVDPPTAGSFATDTVINDQGTEQLIVLFVAAPAPTYFGPAVVSWLDENSAAQQLTFEIVEPISGSVGASFTPTEPPPPPGPCLLVTGDTVAFGDVLVGNSQFTDSLDKTTLGSCTSVSQNVLGQVSDATTDGGVSWAPVVGSPLDPPGANEFMYSLTGERSSPGIPTSILYLGANPARFIDLLLPTGDSVTATHFLKLGAGGDGIGQDFTLTVTFTATTA